MPADMRVGFIGLGVMGQPMAANILAAGYELTVYTRTASRATDVLTSGAAWADSPGDVAATTDVTITMLPDGPDVVRVAQQANGLLERAKPGHTWIDMSSIASDAARELAADAAEVGVHWLDAPVSGGEAGAVAGTLSIMVGGDQDVFERCHAVLASMGSSVIRVGDAGAGQVAKACNQVVVGCAIAAVAEALMLATASGVDPAVVREVLLGGLAHSKVLDVHGDRMLRQAFEPGFRMALHRKDLVNALAAGRAAGSPLPMAATVAELMTAAIAGGGGDLDHAGVVRTYEALASRPLTGHQE